MLSPLQLEQVPASMLALWSQAEADILADMAMRIAAYDMFIPAAEHQFRRLQAMGSVYDSIVKRLAAITGKSERQIRKIIGKATEQALKKDDAVYTKAGMTPPPLSASPGVQTAMVGGLRNTLGLFENLTRTTANTASRQFERALDRAWMKVSTGAFSHTEAVRSAIKELSAKGIEAITYPSGHTDYLDVAVRRAVLTGVNQASLKAQDARADQMGSDLVEVTAHAGARTGDGEENPGNHAWWQGKVYSRSGTHPKYPDLALTGYGTGDGLGGWNCRHNMYVFIEGFSEPAHTQEQLDALNAPKYDYNGKKLTEEEAMKLQRHHERQIRRWKREKAAMKAAGQPTDEASAKLSKWQNTQKDFLKQTGLKRQFDRERVENPVVSDILNSNDGPMTPVTQEVIDGIKPYPSEVLEGPLSQTIAQGHKDVLESVRDKELGTEAVAYYDMAGNKLYSNVGENADMRVRGKRQSVPHVSMHNHPDSSVFSPDDLRPFASNPNMWAITTVGHDGTIQALERTLDADAESLLRHVQDEITRVNPGNADEMIALMETIMKGVERFGLYYYRGRP